MHFFFVLVNCIKLIATKGTRIWVRLKPKCHIPNRYTTQPASSFSVAIWKNYFLFVLFNNPLSLTNNYAKMIKTKTNMGVGVF